MGSSDAIAGRGPRPATLVGGVGLALLCLVVYLPGFFTIPPVDRDESRFAQASRQMLEGGDWVVPRVQDRARLNKPPLIYWLQAGSAWVLTGGDASRDAIWMYRVPSLLAAIAAVLLTWRLGSSMFDPQTARLGAALLACCPMVAWEARQARADMVLLALTMLTMLALWKCWSYAHAKPARTHVGWLVCFWGALGAAVLTKGPIAPMVALLTVLGTSAVMRDWRWLVRLHPWFGIPLVAAMVGPWVWAVAARPGIGWDLYWQTVWNETIGRSAAAKEGHWGPPGYHTVLLPVLFWPGSMLTGLGIAMAWRAVRMRRGAGGAGGAGQAAKGAREVFCLAWIIPSWIVFEIIGTKLPHYTMPMYPALALLSARAVLAAEVGLLPQIRTRLARIGLWGWFGLTAAAGAAGLVAAVAYGPVRLSGAGRILTWSVCLMALLLIARHLLLAYVAITRGKIVRAQFAGLTVAIVLWIIVPLLVLPTLLGLSSRVLGAVDRVDPSHARPLAAVEYQEDSLVFLTRGRVERIEAATLPAWLDSHPTGLVILPRAAAANVPNFNAGATVTGLNYSRGRYEELVIGGAGAGGEFSP